MNSREFNNNLLKLKEEQFEEYVKIAAHSSGLEPPEVKFWDGDCPYGGHHEIAHIHVDLRIICVRKARLAQMSLDEIKDTAIHETMHLIEANHSPAFSEECDKMSLRMWRPPGGVYVGGGNEKSHKEAGKRSKQDKERCNLAFCRKKTTLKRCPFCKLYFCEEHIKPKKPQMRDFEDRSQSLEPNDDTGHPDSYYAEYLINEEERINQQYRENLKKLIVSAPKQKEIEIDLEKIREEEEALEKEADKSEEEKIKNYVLKPVAVAKKCYYCDKEIKKYSYQCNYCQQHFCKTHRHTSSHKCETLYTPSKRTEAKKEEKIMFEETIKEEKEKNINMPQISPIKVKMKRFFDRFKDEFRLDPRFWHVFDKHRFISNLIFLVIFILIFLILNKNVTTLNKYVLLILKVGSSLLIITLFAIIVFIIKIFKSLKIVWRFLGHGWRYLALLIILILIVCIYLHQESYINKTQQKIDSIKFSNFNPFTLSKLNLSTDAVSDKLGIASSSEQSFVELCRTKVEDEAQATIIRGQGDFTFKIDEYKIFNDKDNVTSYLRRYYTDGSSYDICGDADTYVAFRVFFQNRGTSPSFVDKYTLIYVCDGKGDLLSVKMFCW
jgi:predicted nucleic acid binding AN1-type Zn finger protein